MAYEFKNCPTCPTKTLCKSKGKCLNKGTKKTMGKTKGGD